MASRWLVALLLLMTTTFAHALQQAGQVQFVQGLAVAEQPGEAARAIVSGDALFVGDTVTTNDKGFAVLALTDGGKITLRPGTSFAIEKYVLGGPDEGMLARLIKGGLRAVTGLVGKHHPEKVEYKTVTATIGIRGTSFDARLCEEDCKQETLATTPQSSKLPAPLPANGVIARVVKAMGASVALQANNKERTLAEGSPLYAGDEIRTSDAAWVVIGFRDHTLISLNESSRFRINTFAFDHQEQTDNIAVRLLKGGARYMTGLVGKLRPKAVVIETAVATIGIRGTGIDMSCEGPCTQPDGAMPGSASRRMNTPSPAKTGLQPQQPEGFFAHTWQGQIALLADGKSLDVDLDRTGFVGGDKMATLLADTPEFLLHFIAPRPDQLNVDWDTLFGKESDDSKGLYVFVRDGRVMLSGDGGGVELGAGEAGYMGADGKPVRLDPVPDFLLNDPYPVPEFFTDGDADIYQLLGVTLGNPGQDVCEVR
jgi:hypothetical protein